MNMSAPDELAELRAEIDRLDRELIALIARRAEVARRIGDVKAAHGLDVWDAARFDEMMARRRAWATDAGLDESFVEDLFEHIADFCARLQGGQANDLPKG